MPARHRSRTPAGLVRAGVLAFGLALLPGAVSAEPWHRSYEQAQRLLVEGRAAEAEQQLNAAIADRAQSGCRLRTYGVRVRDYIPWYYLGVVLAEQGRGDEAKQALERSLAEGVIDDCPGTRLQALDLLDRLDRLEALAAERPRPAGRTVVAGLRRQAEEARASRWAHAEWRAALAAKQDCPDCPETAEAFLTALSRARIDGPILSLLEQAAREAVREAELEVQRSAVSSSQVLSELRELRSTRESARSASDWLELERRAQVLLQGLRQPTAREAEPVAAWGHVDVLMPRVIAARDAARALPPEVPRSDQERRTLEALLARLRELDRRLSQRGAMMGLDSVEEAEQIREGLVRLSQGTRDRATPPPARLELTWSESAGVARRPLLTEPVR